MTSLAEELTCPVCLDLYEQPVLLPCAHSLCRRCAGDIFAEALRKPKSPAPPSGLDAAPKEQNVECPTCRHEFRLPELGVDGLRRNTTLQNIVDRYRESKNNTAAPKAVPCEMCDGEPPNDAVKTCLVCDTSYCEACLSTYHPMKAGLARHTLVEASSATPKVLMCTEHPQEKVNMFCETDECLVCSLCKLVGKHQDHKVAAVSDTFQQNKESIGGRVVGLIQKNAEVECFVDKIQQTMTKAEQNCADIKGRVEAFAQDLIATIMKKKHVLQTKVEVEKDQKLKTLGQQLGQWVDTGTGISAAITEAEALLNEEDPITFLQTSKTIVDRIAAFEFLEERKLNTTDKFDHNTLRVSDLEQKVSSLDFLPAPEAPKILTDKCTAGRDHISVCWAAGGTTPVDKYHIFYMKASHEEWQGPLTSANYSIKVPDLEGNTAYKVCVMAVNASGAAVSQQVDIKTKRGGQLQFKLDSGTSQASMVVADDGMSVTCSQRFNQAFSSNQARGFSQAFSGVYQPFQGYNQPLTGVLGNVAIDKGRHYWEVDVKGSTDFGLGVAYPRDKQSMGPRGPFMGSYQNQQYMMYASLYQEGRNGEKTYKISRVGMDGSVSQPPRGPMANPFMFGQSVTQHNQPSHKHLTKVGIVLDYDGGSISYYDQNHTLITSQTQQFSQPVHPCLIVKDQGGTLSLVQDCDWPEFGVIDIGSE